MPLYRVPENAPLFIAGERRAAGDLIILPVQAAEYECSLGHLVEVDAETLAVPADLTADERAGLPALGDGTGTAILAEPNGTVASVPFMMTAEMRQRLAALGYSPEDIATLTPADAWALLDHAE